MCHRLRTRRFSAGFWLTVNGNDTNYLLFTLHRYIQGKTIMKHYIMYNVNVDIVTQRIFSRIQRRVFIDA